MQEEVENRTVNLAISTSRLTLRTVESLLKKAIHHLQEQKAKGGVPRGKQSVKKLIGQNQGVSSIEVAKTGLRGFEQIARKYGVDFAIKKDRTESPTRYLVFFKARDADALTAAFKEFTAKSLGKNKRPSVLAQLNQFKELVATIPGRVRQKNQERDR